MRERASVRECVWEGERGRERESGREREWEGERESGREREWEREREREASPGDPWGEARERERERERCHLQGTRGAKPGREREREREAPPPGDLWGGAGGREVPSGPGVLLLVPTHSLDEGLQVRTEMMGPRVS